MRFVIHIGPHKTGSTYLQTGFVKLRTRLQDRGVLYPNWWGAVAQGNLVKRLDNPADEKLVEQFNQIKSGTHHTALLSSEEFSRISRDKIRNFHQLIGDHEVTVVFYVRSWSAVLYSSWRESVKEGHTDTLPEFLYRRISDPTKNPVLNFGLILQDWAAQFGAGALRLIAYDKIMDANIDLLQHFIRQLLGWDNPPRLDLGRINPSLSAEDAEILRAIHAIDTMTYNRKRPQAYARQLSKAYLAVKLESAAPVLRGALANSTARLQINEATPQLAALHSSLYEFYAKALLPPLPRQQFFLPRVVSLNYVNSGYMLHPGAVAALGAIHQRLAWDLDHAGEEEDGGDAALPS